MRKAHGRTDQAMAPRLSAGRPKRIKPPGGGTPEGLIAAEDGGDRPLQGLG